MKITRLPTLFLLASLCLLGQRACAGQYREYVWQSYDGDLGGLAGSIILDSSSNPNGSIDDIVQMTLRDTQLGVWNVTPQELAASADHSIAWTPDNITAIDLCLLEYNPRGQDGLPAAAGMGANEFDIFCLLEGLHPYDADGAWVVNPLYNVPDNLPTFPTLCLATTALVLLGRHHRSRPFSASHRQ